MINANKVIIKILGLLAILYLVYPNFVFAQEEQFITSLDAEVVSAEDCLAKILENEDKIITKLVSLEGELSGSSFYSKTAKADYSVEKTCQASLQIVSDQIEVTEEKLITKKEWKCSAAAEQPKFNSAGQPSCASILLEVNKEADQVELNVATRGDIFLKKFVAGDKETIEHRQPSNVPWWYYFSVFMVMVVIFPAITLAYGRVTKNRDNRKRL